MSGLKPATDGLNLTQFQRSQQADDLQHYVNIEYTREQELLKQLCKEYQQVAFLDGYHLSSYDKSNNRYYTVITNSYDEDGYKIRKFMGKLNTDNKRHIVREVTYCRYLDQAIKQIKQNLTALKRMKKTFRSIHPEVISRKWGKSYQPLPEECYSVSGYVDVNRWREKYRHNHRITEPAYPESLRHQAEHNLMVRSKSEVIICGQLIGSGLSFLYEAEMKIGKYTVHPDFVVLSEKYQRLFVWEHLGMLDQPKYMKSTLWKLQHYQDAGVAIGNNLIVTYDDTEDGIDTEMIKEMISRYLK